MAMFLPNFWLAKSLAWQIWDVNQAGPISLHSPTVFLYLVCTLESHSRFLSLASEKSGTEDVYFWITIERSY